jgi:phosphatidylglycerol:prolipoprotein diacylglycerol transferase
MIAAGFLVAVSVVRRLARASALEEERVTDLVFWLFLVGFIGARVLFVITRWEFFMADPLSILKVWEGGLVYLGGLVACVPFMAWYVRRHRLAPWKTADCMIGLLIIHVFGRLGCLAAGCCYGKPTTAPWAISIHSELVDPMLRGVPLHPTQLYEAAAEALIFLGSLLPVLRPGGIVLALDAAETPAAEAYIARLFLAAPLVGIVQERPRSGALLTLGIVPPRPVVEAL